MSDLSSSLGRLVGEHDPRTGGTRLTSWVPGPAGHASVPLAGGELLLAVDLAEPTTVSFVEVHDARLLGLEARAALAVVLGPSADEVLAAVGTKPSIVRAVDDLARRRRTDPLAQAVARLAVLRSEVEEEALPDLALFIALVQLALFTEQLPSALGLTPRPEQLRGTAVGLFDPLDLEQLEVRLQTGDPEEGAAALEALLGDSTVDVPSALRRALRGMVDRLRRGDDRGEAGAGGAAAGLRHPSEAALAARPEPQLERPAGAAAAPLSLTDAMVEPPAPPRPPSTEVEVEVRSTRAVVVAAGWQGHDLQVHVRRDHEEGALWLRVFEDATDGPVLLALAPFVAATFDGEEAVAFVDPAVERTPSLLVDVTSDPGDRAGPRSHVARALEHGRRAVRLARVGDERADEAWERCAERWRAAGDERRATLAQRQAQGRGSGRGPVAPLVPFLHEHPPD